MNRERIGEMLVAAGLVTPAQLEEALLAQRSTRAPLGKQLVALGYVTEARLVQVLSNQLSVPWVSLERVEFSRELLSRIPGELADRYSVMPIYVRSLRHHGDTLYVAMDDPTHEEALKRVSIAAGLPVKPMIASPSDIRRAIDQHYFAGASIQPEMPKREPEGLRAALERAAESLSTPPRPSEETPRASRLKPPPRRSRPAAAAAEGLVPTEQYETPSQPPADSGRTLTLLDGTQVALPKTGSKRLHQEIAEVRHVIKALRAASADLGVETPLRWHEIVQAVLDALRARGIKLSRKEVAEAWARNKQRSDPTG